MLKFPESDMVPLAPHAPCQRPCMEGMRLQRFKVKVLRCSEMHATKPKTMYSGAC